MANAKRVGSIDFWRGGVLIAILVDHIPGNLLEFFTPRNFGLSDSSEAFVFLSGISVGMVYLPRARRHGLAAVARGCLQRALKLYGVHIALTAAALAIFACAFWVSGVEDLIEAHGRSFVFDSPLTGVTGLAVLTHQLGYFNILPLYVVLMLWAPLALALAMRSCVFALASSVAIYAASRGFGLHLPNWPEPGGWFFNPFAWQLAFTIGLVCAVVWRDGPPRATTGLVALSVATLVVAALATTSGGRPRAGAPRRGFGPPRRRQAGPRTGAARPFRRARLPHRHRSRPDAGDRRAARPRRAEPRAQRSRDLRRGLARRRAGTGGARRGRALYL